MPIQGNGMQARPGQATPAAPNKNTADTPKPAPANDPITAAVTSTLGKLDTGLAKPAVDAVAIVEDLQQAAPKLTPEQAVEVAKPSSRGEVIKGGSEVVLDPDLPRGELEQRLLELRNPPPPVVHVPAPPTPRMVANTEAEMAAGRRRVAHFEEMERNRPKPEHNPRDGHNIEVRRAGEYVHEKGTNSARTV